MSEYESSPDMGSVRISFQCHQALSPEQIRTLSEELVSKPLVCIDAAEVNPDGSGWVLYRDDTVTLDDLSATVRWLQQHPLIAEVGWQMVVDL